LNIRVDYLGWNWQSAEEKSVSVGTNDYGLMMFAGAFSRGSGEGAAFYTSSRLNNQDLNKYIFGGD
jgi:hypothetical protein